jgi:arabinose-5-phosphate isomerase
VLERRGFSSDDFALLHPGGALGRRLLRVRDVMHPSAEVPRVGERDPIHAVVEAITKGGLGVVAVVAEAGTLAGIITDGDLRRALLRKADVLRRAADVMTRSPKTVAPPPGREALATMEKLPSPPPSSSTSRATAARHHPLARSARGRRVP